MLETEPPPRRAEAEGLLVDPRLALRVESLGGAAGVAVGLMGVLVLLGWAFDIATLKSVLPGFVTMKANTAAGFLLAGAALVVLRRRETPAAAKSAARAIAVGVALLGLLTLAEYASGRDLGIDQVLFAEPAGAVGTSAPGRMAPNTAFNFVLVGLALLLVDSEPRRGVRPAQLLVLAAGVVALLGLLSHVYGVRELFGVASLTQMALHTAVSFVLLSLGLLAVRPEAGVTAVLAAEGPGGSVARRLLPAAILVPAALGAVRLQGERKGLYGMEGGLALFALSNIAIFSGLVYWNARRLQAIEAKARRAASRFRDLLEAAPDATVIVDARGRIAHVNAQTEALFGYGPAELIGAPIEQLVPERSRGPHQGHRAGFLAAPRTRAMGVGLSVNGRRKDGSEFPAEISLRPIEAEQGLLVCAAVRDVTARRQAQAELTRRARQQAAVATLGQRALAGADISGLMDEAVAAVAETLEVELAKVLELRPEGDALLLRAGVGWREGLVGRATVEAGPGSQAGYTLHVNAPVVVEDLASEARFSGPPLLLDHGVVAGVSVVIAGGERPFGVLGAHSRSPRRFSPDDLHFLQGVANVLAEGIQRWRAEDALRSSEASLSEAQRVAHMGNWDWDVRTGDLRWSDEVYRIFGLSPGEFGATYEAFLRSVHPDDRPQVEEAVRAALHGRAPYAIDHRVLRPDGTQRIVHQEGQVSLDDTRAPVRMIGTVQDVTERRRHEELKRRSDEIEEQNRRIQEASRLKSEFLANMSHELRTPLNAIIGFAELIHDGKVGPVASEHKEYLGDILTSGRHLQQLIDDVLDLSKVESGRMEFRPEPVDLSKLVAEVRDILRTLAAEKRVHLETRIDPALGGVVADSRRLKQVLYNYLSNALKFTPEQGRVSIRLGPQGADAFRLEVEDTGVGIRPQDLGRLFVEFQQLDAGSAKRHPGTGLGLALTRGIVEAQGGHVGVRSTLGKGSVFFAVLPRVLRPEAVAEAGRAPHSAPRSGAPVVLVVEDDVKDRAWLVETLAGAGYNVATAASGAEALALGRERVFDAIVLDLLLPDMSGWDALRAIRAIGQNRDTPTIVVTVVVENHAAAGFAVQDYLRKPLKAEDLLAALERAGVPPGRTRPVLVVDDEPKDRKLMEATLTELGYRAVCAADGVAGLEAAASDPPAAVVLDLLMPGMDGFEFLERFRHTPQGRRTPVIVWTAHDLTGQALERLEASAQAIVSKAHGADALIEELRLYVPAPGGPGRRGGEGGSSGG